ncbi:MAG: hypothetical protein GY950_29895, partial [bacterium]|nr:hypothetical protein [bacterium]
MKRIAGRILTHPAFYLILILFISILVLNVQYPKIGRDYSYFVPRLLDSHLFYLNNGVQIQWWTPSFGGGLPSYPNPQQMQFSPAQFFLFTGNPWTAINLSVLMLISIGFFSTYLLFKQITYAKDQAVLAATLFSTTAFYIEHLSVGHLGYLAFPLLPLVLLLLIHERLPVPAAAAGLALTIAFLSYSAGFYAAAIFVFSVPLSLLLVYLLSWEPKLGYRRLFVTAAAGGIAGILISGSKLTAVLSHMRYFPRFIEVEYSANIFEALLGVLCQLFFTPIAVFFKRLDIETFFQDLVGTGPGMGVWEFDIGLSPVILGILLGSFFLLKKKRIKEATGRRKKTVLLVLILVLCWMSLEITIADGIVYKYLKSNFHQWKHKPMQKH